LSVDYLEQIIADMNSGAVDLAHTQARLDFDMAKRDKPMKLTDYAPIPSDPLDGIIATEHRNALADALEYLCEVLCDEDKRAWAMVAHGYTDEDIADALGISLSTLRYRYERIREYADGIQGLLRKDSPEYYASSPKVKVRYPMDAARHHGIGGHQGKKRWVTSERCVLPEYFKECFGDDATICTLCERRSCQC
jgi:hypothetical protein